MHFTALGTFIHPPGTRDITNEVTWKADAPQVVNLNGGVVTTNGACGITNIYASTNKDRQRQESIMPVLLVPFLIGVPVVLGGGYIIYHLVH